MNYLQINNINYISFILFIYLLFNCVSISIEKSGFYIDNGKNQTVLQAALDPYQTQEVEYRILELLGLPDRPRKKNMQPHLRKSAPKFLMDVYKRLTDESNEGSARYERSVDEFDENLITETDKKAIEESDIIMTFLNKNHHASEMRHERGRTLWFDVSEVSRDITLSMAELRIYQNPNLGKWKNEFKEFTISVYAIVNIDGKKDLEIITSINTTSEYQGWLEMNVTNGLTKWLSNIKDNKGLYIGAHTIDRTEHEVKLDDIGLVNTKGDDEYQPFMIGYFNGQTLVKTKKHGRRLKRSPQRRRKKSTARNPIIDHKADYTLKSCQIQTLYVSFKDLSWHDWIIAPDGYGAYYCSGECNFPLNAHMNATNHAIVQTLVHLMHPGRNHIPKPCCAPTKLSPISVLYFLDESNVNLKKYRNMVVKSCGCH